MYCIAFKDLETMNYFICSTYRTGSNLLYHMLKRTEVAGNPLELFLCLEQQWREKYPQYWSDCKELTPNLFLKNITAMGTGYNGVFACKMMWDSFVTTMEYLRNIPQYQDKLGVEILSDIFPEPKFILTSRKSKVRQAVSYVKAKKNGIFFQRKSNIEILTKEKKSLNYDFISIFTSYQNMIKAEMNWMRILVENDIKFKNVIYEDLAKEPLTVLKDVLEFLEIDFSIPKNFEPDIVKQSDEINDYWTEKFTQDMLEKGFSVT